MNLKQIQKTEKCYTIKNGKEIPIKILGILNTKKQVLASEQGNECKSYTNKDYKNWFVKTKTKYLKTTLYL